jgi:hypothetical protein
LHNDIYPPNVGLPRERTGGDADSDGQLTLEQVVLIDWEMVGWGLAETDLAYLFLQPYRSAAAVNREEALEFYWQERRRLEGDVPTAAERRFRQAHADGLLALWLLPVAARMATTPHPVGSAPHTYWSEMFQVLGERLALLCGRVE